MKLENISKPVLTVQMAEDNDPAIVSVAVQRLADETEANAAVEDMVAHITGVKKHSAPRTKAKAFAWAAECALALALYHAAKVKE